MAPVNNINKYARSWGFCSPYMREDLNYIIEIIEKSFKREIIKKNEYRDHLMIITDNCNQHIMDNLPIDKTLLKEEEDKKKGYYNINKYDGQLIQIRCTENLDIIFDKDDKHLTYEEVFNKKNLLNDTYKNTYFMISSNNDDIKIIPVYVIIIKKAHDTYEIINISTGFVLNNEIFSVYASKGRDSSHFTGRTVEPYAFTSIAIINDKVKADKYNKQPGGGILSKNKGKKGVYKSTKQKISVIIDKKSCDRTVYKNAKGISYIRCNNEYKLLKKYKLVKK